MPPKQLPLISMCVLAGDTRVLSWDNCLEACLFGIKPNGRCWTVVLVSVE
jgi:hypothetical protein